MRMSRFIVVSLVLLMYVIVLSDEVIFQIGRIWNGSKSGKNDEDADNWRRMPGSVDDGSGRK
jgi:hypothetical protein